MGAEKFEVVKNWSKPKIVCNIQIFLSFTNFYWQFIQSFNRIVALITSMLNMTVLSEISTSKILDIDCNKIVKINKSKEFTKKSKISKG